MRHELIDVHELPHGVGVMTWRHPDGFYETVVMLLDLGGHAQALPALHRTTSYAIDQAVHAHCIALEAARRTRYPTNARRLPDVH